MAHHKRRRPKNRRGGCLMCKRHKINGLARESAAVLRPGILRRIAAAEASRCA